MRVGCVDEWDGRPVERNAMVDAVVDPVPVDQLGEAPPAEPHAAAQEPEAGPDPLSLSARAERHSTVRSVGKAEVEPTEVIAHVRALLGGGNGSSWHRISWALMAGDLDAARGEVRVGLEHARRIWEQPGRFGRPQT